MSRDIVDKFSTHLKNVLTRALCLVVESDQKVIEPEHLLWALGTQKGCIGSELLRKVSIKQEKLRTLVKGVSGNDKATQSAESLTIHLSERSKRMLEKAVLTANIYGHRYIGTEHLLSGMLQISDNKIESFLKLQSVDLKELRGQLAIVLKSTSRFPDLAESVSFTGSELSIPSLEETTAIVQEENPEEPKKTPALDFFGRDLTTAEVQANIDPVIGRDEEIDRLMEILCRRTKNNPLLIGDPGVGKTAIVEGFAKRVAKGHVPPPLQNKRIVALDLPLIIAGTMYRGEFEGRLRQIIDEVKENPDIIIFIDEIHTMVGAGAATGSLDAANILKPALARGEVRCIGATTLEEFKKHIETDSALERRFQTIQVDEPSQEKALEILQGVAPYYESFHGVRISPAAIESSVQLSARYIQNRQLPDKAIDLLDEAAASVRVHAPVPGPVEQKQQLQQKIREIQDSKRQAVVEEKFVEAINLKEQERSIRSQLQTMTADKPTQTMPVITGRDVAGVVSRMMKIPLEDLLSEQRERLIGLADDLASQVIGQDKVVQTVASAMTRAKTGLSDPNRPLTSLLFLGPSGVGKTELAKALARVAFHDPKALIRLDMSEYAEGFTMSKLIGAPAGYVGFRESAKLTDMVKHRPYSVVLFDELEKAHKDVQNLLLQILEEGEISDATGRKINFRNTVVVMTSNVGLERFEKGGLGFASSIVEAENVLHEDLKKELSERFRPELLNRIDHTCIFTPLDKKALENIAQKQLQELVDRVSKQEISLNIESEIAGHIAKMVEGKYGARDVRRHILSKIENQIAERLTKRKGGGEFRVRLRGKSILVTQSRGK